MVKKSEIEWRISETPVEYPDALSFMDERVAGIHAARDPSAPEDFAETRECIWFLEHPPLYTAGTSAKDADLLDTRFPVFETGRGGEHTYHGPGQRVAYVMLDLKTRARQLRHSGESRNLLDVGGQDPGLRRDDDRGAVPDIKKYVWNLEEVIIRSLAAFGINGERRCGRVGIWVVMPDGSESKIAAIGVRVRHWITLHGIAVNVKPDLSHFGGIVPCGIAEHGVTSMAALGVDVDMADVDAVLQDKFAEVFLV